MEKRRQNQTSSTYNRKVIEKIVEVPEMGKIPPQAVDIERAVLGALLNEGKSIELIDLKPEDFYVEPHQIIFTAIENLHAKRKPIDMLTVSTELKSLNEIDNIGSYDYIAELTGNIASSAHIQYHAAILKQKSLARKLIVQSYEVIGRAFDESEDVGDIIEDLEKSFTELRSGDSVSMYYDMNSSINRTMNYLINIQENRQSGESVCISTGLKELDEMFSGGWSAPDLIILGGRPSMGKSQFALHFAQTAAKTNNHCLFVSIEMTLEQIVMRMLIEDERLDLYNMRTGQLTNDDWRCIDERIAQIQNQKLIIADDYNIRYLSNIKSLARKLHRSGQLDLLIIDYLQLIKTNLTFGTRDLEIGYITGELKNLAKELSIPAILLAQLSRPAKTEKVPLPVLSDLRESGNIEQDADKVIFPHRPTYYNPDATDGSGQSWKNRGVLIIGKNREGEKDGKVYFRTDDKFKKIYDDHVAEASTPFIHTDTNF